MNSPLNIHFSKVEKRCEKTSISNLMVFENNLIVPKCSFLILFDLIQNLNEANIQIIRQVSKTKS